MKKYTTNSSFLKKLINTNVYDQRFFDNPYVCFSYEKIIDIWKQLIKDKDLSAPVIDTMDNSIIGFVDLADIVFFCIRNMNKRDLMDNYYELVENDNKFKSMTAMDILNLKRNPRYFVKINNRIMIGNIEN
jgi:hypothetical protein